MKKLPLLKPRAALGERTHLYVDAVQLPDVHADVDGRSIFSLRSRGPFGQHALYVGVSFNAVIGIDTNGAQLVVFVPVLSPIIEACADDVTEVTVPQRQDDDAEGR